MSFTNLPVQISTTMTLGHTGIASESGSMGTGADFLSSDWCIDWDIPQLFNMDSVALENTSLFQELFEPSLPSLWSTGEFHPTISSEIQLGASSQEMKRNVLSPLPEVPGPSSSQPQITQKPLDDNVRDREACYKGAIGARLQAIDEKHSSIVVPTIPPPVLSSPLSTTLPLNWFKVPQRNYDHGRKQWSFEQLEPVLFSVGGRPGINMRDALRKTFEGLDGRDDPVLQDAAAAISCRFLFPGYPANSGSCQIHALDWTRKRQPITRSKLSHEVAKNLERYLRRMAKFTPDKSVEHRWKIGQGFMHIDNMFLVRFVSVSKGSFQPEIWVMDPST